MVDVKKTQKERAGKQTTSFDLSFDFPKSKKELDKVISELKNKYSNLR